MTGGDVVGDARRFRRRAAGDRRAGIRPASSCAARRRTPAVSCARSCGDGGKVLLDGSRAAARDARALLLGRQPAVQSLRRRRTARRAVRTRLRGIRFERGRSRSSPVLLGNEECPHLRERDGASLLDRLVDRHQVPSRRRAPSRPGTFVGRLLMMQSAKSSSSVANWSATGMLISGRRCAGRDCRCRNTPGRSRTSRAWSRRESPARPLAE